MRTTLPHFTMCWVINFFTFILSLSLLSLLIPVPVLPRSLSLCHPVTLLTKHHNNNVVTTTPQPQSPNIAWPRRCSLPLASVLYGKGLISCWLHLLRFHKYFLGFNCPWFCQCYSSDIDQTIGKFWTDYSY